jgi:hypothetical protein
VQSDVQIEQRHLRGTHGPKKRIARREAEQFHPPAKADEIVRAREQGVADTFGLRRRDVVLGHAGEVKERAGKGKRSSFPFDQNRHFHYMRRLAVRRRLGLRLLGKRLAEWVAVFCDGRKDQHPLNKSDTAADCSR